MTNADRFKLMFGPYKTPRFHYGDVVTGEFRDWDVVNAGISNTRIPWPIGNPKGSAARGLARERLKKR